MCCLSCCMEVNAGRWTEKSPGNLMYSKLNVSGRCIKRIFWPNKNSNKDLLTSCNLEPLSVVARKRRWRWLGHVLWMETDSLPRVAFRWTPQGRHRRGRPKVTWWRTMARELKEVVSASKQLGDVQKIGSSGGPLRKPHVPLWALWVLSEWVSEYVKGEPFG